MKKITFLMLPLLLVTMVSCGLKDTLWNENSDVSLNLEKNILQQVNRNVFADKKAEETDESKVVNFVCTISGDYSNTQTQPVDFANEVNTVSFTFENLPVGGIIDVEMVLILESTGDELYRGKTESVKVLSNNATKVQIRLSKASEKLKDLFYPKTVFDGKWVTSKKNAILGNGGDLYYLDDSQLTQTKPTEILKERGVQDYCFDSEGEVWYVVDGGEVQLYKNAKNIMGWSEWTEPFYPDRGGFKLAYDKVTDEILIYQNYEETHIFVIYNTKDNSSISLNSDSFISELRKYFDINSNITFSNIAVHNSSIYSTVNYETYDGEKYEYHNCLIKYEVKGEELSLSKDIDLKNVLGISNNKMSFFTPTDMEIQSDLLFVTYQVNSQEYYGFLEGVYNYGGVLIFNLDDLSQIIPSGSSKTGVGSIDEKRSVKIDSDYYVKIDGGTLSIQNNNLFPEEYLRDTFKPNFSLYTPDSVTSDKYLFGPQQIIAIKPKKLVVLDKGIFLYIDDGDPSYKIVNRVVEIDLESRVFESQTPISIGKSTGTDEVNVSFLADEEMAKKSYEYSCGGSTQQKHITRDTSGHIVFINADN